MVLDDIPRLVRGDSARTVQIFANLLANSIKFTSCMEVLGALVQFTLVALLHCVAPYWIWLPHCEPSVPGCEQLDMFYCAAGVNWVLEEVIRIFLPMLWTSTIQGRQGQCILTVVAFSTPTACICGLKWRIPAAVRRSSFRGTEAVEIPSCRELAMPNSITLAAHWTRH